MKLTTQSASLLGCLALGAALGVPSAQAELKHRYQFNDAAGTTVLDSVGTAHGTLVNNTGLAAFDGNRLTLGNNGTQASNADTGDFVDLPNGLITGLNTGAGTTRFALEAWFTRTGGNTWQRVYDFGTSVGGEGVSDSGDGTAQMFLTPQSGGTSIRAAWRPQGGGEVQIERPGISTLNELTQTVFVWDETTTSARLYVNGVEVAANTAVAMTIASGFYAGETPLDVNNWLGRAQWNDSLFVGSFDEFRVWQGALNPVEVAEKFLGGPDNPAGGNLGALAAVSATGAASIILGETTRIRVNADYQNFAGINVSALATFSSSNPNAATVNASGVVTAVNPGDTVITATYLGQSDTVAINVAVPARPPAVLAHRYSFGDAVDSTVLADSVGSLNGTVLGTVAFTGTGTANFPGDRASYIDLPNGIASGLGANGTIEAWVTFPSSGAGGWQRVFDFGNTSLGEDPVHPDLGGPGGYSGVASWFYAPRTGAITANNGGRYAFDPGPGGESPQINPPAALGAPLDTEFHVVATYNHAQRVAQIWINGQLAGQGTVLADRPLSSLEDVNNWLGRSQWSGDANATATFNEFRMYSGVPSELEIAVSRAAGPDTIIADPGAVESLAMQAGATAAVAGGPAVPLSLLANFMAIDNVNVSFVPGVTITSSDTSVARILTGPTRILPVGPGTATINGGLGGQSAAPLSFTVSPAPALQLAHRYAFDANANDAIGSKHGELITTASPGPVFEDGGLTLAGNGYVNLPNFLFTDFFFQVEPENQPAVTLELFGSWAGGPNWQRVLDFGDTTFAAGAEDPPVGETYNGRTTLFITPSNGGVMRFDFTTANAGGAVGRINATPLGANQDFHVVVVFDPRQGLTRMYRNGVFVGLGALPATVGTGLRDDATLLDVNVWLGRSQFGADPLYNGRITEFRIWRGGMTEAQARLNYNCGPDNPNGCTIPAAPTIGLNQAGGATTIAWPASAYGYNMHTTTTLGASTVWTPAAAQPLTTQGVRRFNVNPAGGAAFFQLQTDN
jgi:hypothetical protein